MTQEGLIMFVLFVGMVVVWGVWLLRMIKRWADEEQAWQRHQQRMARIERERISSRNYRYSND
jgi:biopolymer transport protein ExbB/TolQ